MKFTAKRVVVSGAVAGVAVVAAGATVIATAADPVAPEISSSAPAEAGHENEGKYTTGTTCSTCTNSTTTAKA